jgi:hypothetical protein
MLAHHTASHSKANKGTTAAMRIQADQPKKGVV